MMLGSVDGSIVVVRSGSVTVAMVTVDKRCVCVYVCIQYIGGSCVHQSKM